MYQDLPARVHAERFWAKVGERDRSDACWPWLGKIDRYGYGTITSTAGERRVMLLAHRVAYELRVGPIPEGLVIDHLCRNRRCVNPAHMEPVTNAENLRRGEAGLWKRENLAAACHVGHPFDAANTLMRADGRGRICRACARERRRRSEARRAAA